MCCGGCAKCLGAILMPLAVLCAIANILLFFPGGTVQESANISDEVWYLGGILGSGVLMVFPALVFLGLKNNDCCGCCGNESCGKRFAMFSSIIFAAVGMAGAGYSLIVASLGVHKGPRCIINGTTWDYPFKQGKIERFKAFEGCRNHLLQHRNRFSSQRHGLSGFTKSKVKGLSSLFQRSLDCLLPPVDISHLPMNLAAI